MRHIPFFAFFLGLVLSGFVMPEPSQAQNGQSCGEIGNACKIALGEYNVALPDIALQDKDTRIPAVLFFHGAGRSGEVTLKDKAMISTLTGRGYAVLAPTGLMYPESRFGAGWSFFPHRKKLRDEMAFSREILDDATQRFGIDRKRVLMSGFSVGGSLTWYLACQDPDIATAYAPVSGAFWRPHPEASDCKGPVKLMHTHGWTDQTVPLEGRPLRSGVYQGDVFQGLQILREVNACNGLRADEFEMSKTDMLPEEKMGTIFWQRWWTRCTPGSDLRFVLFPGGHDVPKGWADLALDWFEEVTRPDPAVSN